VSESVGTLLLFFFLVVFALEGGSYLAANQLLKNVFVVGVVVEGFFDVAVCNGVLAAATACCRWSAAATGIASTPLAAAAEDVLGG
jgi:hypothetical protein